MKTTMKKTSPQGVRAPRPPARPLLLTCVRGGLWEHPPRLKRVPNSIFQILNCAYFQRPLTPYIDLHSAIGLSISKARRRDDL